MSGFPYKPPTSNDFFYNSNAFPTIVSDSRLVYLSGITEGIASASKALVLDSLNSISNMGAITQSMTNGGDMITLTTSNTNARNTIKFNTDNQQWEIGSRGSTANNGTNFYIYNGAYKLLINPTGDTSILSSTDATSLTTGALKVSGGISCQKQLYCQQLSVNYSTSHITLNNTNASTQALIELSTSPSLLRFINGYAMNLGSNGLQIASGGGSSARTPLDLGSTAANKIITLYDSTTTYYGMGANNSNLILSSNGGFTFYTDATSASPLATQVANLQSNGNLLVLNNLQAKAGFFSGVNNTGLTGEGLKIHYSAASHLGQIFAYDYSAGSYKDLQIGGPSGPYMNCTSGFMGIGATGSISFPLVVLNSISSSITGGYGWLSASGTSTGSTTGSVSVSAYFGERVFAKEVDCFSDERLKHMIEPIDGEKALRFIKEVVPIQYEWRSDDSGKRTGYSAQQLLKTGLFPDLVTLHLNDKMKSEIDSDGFESPEGYHFAVQYSNAVAILHKAIQMQQKQLEAQRNEIDQLILKIKILHKI